MNIPEPQRRGRLPAVLFGLALSGAAWAQSPTPGGVPPPTGMSLAESAARRFPQPVVAGALLNRTVLWPVESQAVVGTVRRIVRGTDGTVLVVIAVGGVFGIGARPIAIPLDAMVLLGDVMEVVAYTPDQLRALPAFQDGGTTPVPDGTVLRVGLAKPSH